ncbi:MAG: aminoglycoside 3-phosphotransferase [Solirubrobacteraceae bacterium]|nr:aminoglycoside 3-phosphotransferase [Solirubrobacteraceae bacterium]
MSPPLAGLVTRSSLVAARSDGTSIHRVSGGRRGEVYVKLAPALETSDPRFNPAAEAERLRWLAEQGLPVPAVVDVGAGGGLRWLVTAAVAGRPAADATWSARERLSVLDAVADVARTLHALPTAECPFDGRLAVTLPRARAAVATGTVDLDDLDPGRRGATAADLLRELDATPPPAEDDLVVCHGDLCLDNVLVDAAGREVVALVDAGRAGVADRWQDLAIVLRNFGGDEGSAWGFRHHHAERFALRYGLAAVDERKRRFYGLLDEFS